MEGNTGKLKFLQGDLCRKKGLSLLLTLYHEVKSLWSNCVNRPVGTQVKKLGRENIIWNES